MIFNPLFISNSNSVNNFSSSKFGNRGYLLSDIINVNDSTESNISELNNSKFKSFLKGDQDSMDNTIRNAGSVSRTEKVFANGYRLNKEAVNNFVENLIHNANSIEIDKQKIDIHNPSLASGNVLELLDEKLSGSRPIELNITNNTNSLSLEIQNYSEVLKTNDLINSSYASAEIPNEVTMAELNKLSAFINNSNVISEHKLKIPFHLKVELGEIVEKLNPYINSNERIFANQNQLIEEIDSFLNKYLSSNESISIQDKQVINSFVEFLQQSGVSSKLDEFNKNFRKVLMDNVDQILSNANSNSELESTDNNHAAGLVSLLNEKELSHLIGIVNSFNGEYSAAEIKQIIESIKSGLTPNNEEIYGNKKAKQVSNNLNGANAELSLNSVRSELKASLKTDETQFVTSIKDLLAKINNAPAEIKRQVLSDDHLKPMLNAAIAKLKMLNQPTEQLKDQLQKLVTLPSHAVNKDNASFVKTTNDGINIEPEQNGNETKTGAINSEKLLKLTSVSQKENNEFVLKVLSQKELLHNEQKQLKNLITKQSDSNVSKLNDNLNELVRNELNVNEKHSDSNVIDDKLRSSSKFTTEINDTIKGFANKQHSHALNSSRLVLGKTFDEVAQSQMSTKLNEKVVAPQQNDNSTQQSKEIQEIKNSEQKVDTESKTTTSTNSENSSSEFNMNSNSNKSNYEFSSGKYSGEQQIKNNSNTTPSFDKVMDSEHQLKSNINERVQIIKDVQLNSVNTRIESAIASRNTQLLTLKLNPVTLGKIDISIELIDNTINANIEVENEVVRQSVQANIDQLKQSLIQQGLHPQSLSVSLSNSDDKNNKYLKNKKRSQHNREVELENNLEQDAPKKMGYNTYDFIA